MFILSISSYHLADERASSSFAGCISDCEMDSLAPQALVAKNGNQDRFRVPRTFGFSAASAYGAELF
jgi:hypothetical protein